MDVQTIAVLFIVLAATVYGGVAVYKKSAGFVKKDDCGDDCGCGKK